MLDERLFTDVPSSSLGLGLSFLKLVVLGKIRLALFSIKVINCTWCNVVVEVCVLSKGVQMIHSFHIFFKLLGKESAYTFDAGLSLYTLMLDFHS